MTGAKIRVELDDRQAQAMFDRMQQGVVNAKPLFDEIGSVLEGSARERIQTTKRAPDGTPWLALSPKWAAKKAEKGYAPGILTMRGDLLNSVAAQPAGPNFVDIIAGPTTYAAIHQYGGQAGRGGKVNIPARPYLGLSDEDQAEIREATDDWLAGLAGG